MRDTVRRFPVGKKVPAAVGAVALLAATIGAAPHIAGADDGDGGLTEGAVFAMSNASADDGGNVVVAYSRNDDGTLEEAGRFPTGGAGSGSFEDSANSLVLGTSQGEAAPNNLIELADGGQQLLFAVNAGSDSVSVFQVHADGLELVDVEDSNGDKPVSVSVNDGRVVVLNSGETFDDLFDADGNVVDNCTTGHKPEVTGFTVTDAGDLTPINGATTKLSGESVSGCAQVSFTPDGSAVVVTERLAQPSRLKQQKSDNERLDDEGVLDVFTIKANGTFKRQLVDATGQGPFGFTFLKSGALLTTEQSDGPGGVARGTATSYVFDDNGELLRSAPAIQNGGTDTCWFAASDSQTLGFSTSFFGDGRISSYELDELGIVRLIEAVASGPDAVNDDVALGASDISFNDDSRYLYQLNSINGTVSAFANNGDGTLSLIEQESAFPQDPFGPGMGMAAPMGLAAN